MKLIQLAVRILTICLALDACGLTSAGFADEGDGLGFSVTTVSIKQSVHHDIQLVFPPHKSTLSPGIVKFTWKLNELKAGKNNKSKRELAAAAIAAAKSKLKVVLERDGWTKEFPVKKGKTEKNISCEPGQYRWHVVGASPTLDSRWRLFKVIEFRGRNAASVTEIRTESTPTDSISIEPMAPNAPNAPNASNLPLHKETIPRVLPPKRVPAEEAKPLSGLVQ